MRKVKAITITARQYHEMMLIKAEDYGDAMADLIDSLFEGAEKEYNEACTEENIIMDVMDDIRKNGGVEYE